jgi:hypothetical protein
MDAVDPSPVVVLGKGSGFFRVVTRPPEALPADWHHPRTYTARCLACDAAALLGKVTGFPVVDETQPKGSGHG